MAYIKYKEISKFFNFSKVKPISDLPYYVLDYIYPDETIVVAYKTFRDHGVFTDKKIVLFDNRLSLEEQREIIIVPYTSITSLSVIFKNNNAAILLYLESGYQLKLKFVKMTGIDKKRLRLLYCLISKIVSNQRVTKEEINTLATDDINFNKEEK